MSMPMGRWLERPSIPRTDRIDQHDKAQLRMANNPSTKKRQREKDLKDRRVEKALLKKQRRDERANRAPGDPGVDPDIADIVPGPQPIPFEDSEL